MSTCLPHAITRTALILALAIASPAVSVRAQVDGEIQIVQPIPDLVAPASREPVTIDLRDHFGTANVTGSLVLVETNRGNMTWELYDAFAPINVANFLGYVRSGRYLNSVVHRSVPGFVIQGGGYLSPDLSTITRNAPVPTEFFVSNLRGTVAFAKSPGDPDSATSEWFVNLADNSTPLDTENGGYTVFARVIGTGMSVVDSIAGLATVDAFPGNPDAFDTLPLTDGTLPFSESNLVIVRSIRESTLYPTSGGKPSHFSFNATSGNTSLVVANLTNSRLRLTFPTSEPGNTTVSVTGRDTNGNPKTDTFSVTLLRGASLNNAFAQAVVLSGSSDSKVGRSTGASKEPGEPDHVGNDGGASLWYRWTAPSESVVTITTDGSSFDTLLAVYTGNQVGALVPITSNDNHDGLVTSQVTFRPVTGTTYQIAVDGKDGTAGRVQIALRTATAGTPTAGRYVGIIAGDETVHVLNGWIDLLLNSRGSFSAKALVGRRTLRFSGTFRADGSYTRSFPGEGNLQLRLQLGAAALSGELWAGDYGGSIDADWTGTGLAGGSSVPPGRYTLAFDIPSQPSGNQTSPRPLFFSSLPSRPAGYGFASLLIRNGGLALFSGRLADGEAFSASAPLSPGNRVALGMRMREGREMVAGFVHFASSGNAITLSGNVGWTKTAIDNDRLFPEGFAATVGVSGGDYQVPRSGELVIDLARTPDNAQFNVSGGNLRREIPPEVGTLTRDNRFRDFDRIRIDFDRTTGLLEGRFYDPGHWNDRSWQGIALRRSDRIVGWFSGERGTGAVTVAAPDESSGNGTDTGNITLGN